jgi:hypothetical protein
VKWKNFESDKWTIISTFLAISSGLLFAQYYIPSIVEMQTQRITESELFQNIHFVSELDFKLFVFAILILLFLNLKKALR